MMNKTLRHGEFESAKKLLSAYASALKRCSVTLKDGSTYIPEGAVGDLTRAINWGDDVTAVTVRQASGLKTADIPKLEDPDIVSAYETLRDLGLYTPMELVNTLIMIPEMGLRNALLDSGSSPADLRNAFGSAKARMRKIQRDFPRKNAYMTAIRKTALVVSPDDKLERATRFGESMRIMEPAVEALDRNRWQRMDRNFIYGLISHSPPSGPSGGKSLSLLTAMGWSGQTSDARMYVFMASFGSSVCARVQRALASATFSHASS